MLRNNLFALLMFAVTVVSCAPSTTVPTMLEISASPTARILPTTTHTSTPDSLPTIMPSLLKTPFPTATPFPFDSAISPNGEFVANAYFEHQLPSGLQTIEIRDNVGRLLWQVPYQGELPTSDPRPTLYILQWSNDSSHLYFYYHFSPDGGDRAFWWTGFDLQQIDVMTGEIQSVLPGKGFISFVISPDGTQIAYTRQQDDPSIFHIRDLSTRSEKNVLVLPGSKSYSRVGAIHWSPSGKEIAFQTETDDFTVQTILMNPTTMKQKVLLEYNLFSWIFIDGWAHDGKLQFSQLPSDGTQIVKVFQIDTATSQTLVIGTPTSGP